MSLDATPKGATSDSYATLEEANLYHSKRLHNDEWLSAPNTTKEAALQWATRLLDTFDWKGGKTTSTQALKWPRYDVFDSNSDELDNDTIPQFLVNAVSEYAWELIKGDREVDSDTKGIREVMAGEVIVKFDKFDRASKTPNSIYRIVKDYLAAGASPYFTTTQRA